MCSQLIIPSKMLSPVLLTSRISKETKQREVSGTKQWEFPFNVDFSDQKKNSIVIKYTSIHGELNSATEREHHPLGLQISLSVAVSHCETQGLNGSGLEWVENRVTATWSLLTQNRTSKQWRTYPSPLLGKGPRCCPPARCHPPMRKVVLLPFERNIRTNWGSLLRLPCGLKLYFQKTRSTVSDRVKSLSEASCAVLELCGLGAQGIYPICPVLRPLLHPRT